MLIRIRHQSDALSIDLALEVAGYFRVSDEKAIEIISVIQSEVSQWKSVAEKVGIPKSERNAVAKGIQGLSTMPYENPSCSDIHLEFPANKKYLERLCVENMTD